MGKVTVTYRINEIYRKLNISVSDFAKKLNLSRQAVYGLFKGAIPSLDTVERLAKLAKCSSDYILGLTNEFVSKNDTDDFKSNEWNTEHLRKIRLLGEIACGNPIYADEDKDSYVLCSPDIKADFCLKAKGDSMTGARILDGDIVFCRSQEMVENGEIAAVIIDDEATLKRVFFDEEQKQLKLQAANDKYEPFIYTGEQLKNIRILGKAIAFQSDIR